MDKKKDNRICLKDISLLNALHCMWGKGVFSGKSFVCEICHCITPIECEGSEPNTCADCMPINYEEK